MNKDCLQTGVVSLESIKYIADRLDVVIGDFLKEGENIDKAYKDKADLVKRREQLLTSIKLDESTALMEIEGEGKTQFVYIKGVKTFLPNETARDAYRRSVTGTERTLLANISGEIASIDCEIARAKDRYKVAADAADSLKATAAVQAALLNFYSKGLG